MAVTRIYEDGLLPVTFTDEEEKKLNLLMTRPARVKNWKNQKTPCAFNRMLFDIQKYVDNDTQRRTR